MLWLDVLLKVIQNPKIVLFYYVIVAEQWLLVKDEMPSRLVHAASHYAVSRAF